MALPSSGPITMAMVAAEIGISASGLSLNDSRVRQLAGKPSGAISFADLLGKSWLLPPQVGTLSGMYVEFGRYTVDANYCHDCSVTNTGGDATSISVTVSSGRAEIRSASGLSFRICNTNGTYSYVDATLTVTLSNARGSNSKNFPIRIHSSNTGA